VLAHAGEVRADATVAVGDGDGAVAVALRRGADSGDERLEISGHRVRLRGERTTGEREREQD
jgi:hypothetical protein